MIAAVPPADASERLRYADRFARAVLPEVSRTFAISIRFLPGMLGRAVLTAYLLCRIADTIEDDGMASPERKAELLDAFLRALSEPKAADEFPLLACDIRGDPAHVDLLRHTDHVCVLLRSLPARSRARVEHWVGVMVHGMRKFVGLYPRGIRIQTIAEYREYCYYVAGTVGCLLTELWHEHAPSVGKAEFARLWVKCQQFGEALQTVNILKDIAWDAEHENAIYIPESTLAEHGSGHTTLLSGAHAARNRAAIATFIQLAWRDLDDALVYTLMIPRRALAIRAFCVLPLLFAHATLRDLARTQAPLNEGETVKISRAEVRSLTTAALVALVSNRALRSLVKRVRARPFVPFAASAA
ncbi:MAG TPA: squalene/phytoene synthase family protein [Gemmatimonadaceae bacterium]|nr:squalene/phytoene synthase family protein [Gemmatimonadaceae bacterium]